jgi:hypothetical protein
MTSKSKMAKAQQEGHFMKKKTKLRFEDLPKNYEALCRLFLPRPLRAAADYAKVVAMTDVMAPRQEEVTGDQADYYELLCWLIEEYDAKRLKKPQFTLDERTRHESGGPVGIFERQPQPGLGGAARRAQIVVAPRAHFGPALRRVGRQFSLSFLNLPASAPGPSGPARFGGLPCLGKASRGLRQ